MIEQEAAQLIQENALMLQNINDAMARSQERLPRRERHMLNERIMKLISDRSSDDSSTSFLSTKSSASSVKIEIDKILDVPEESEIIKELVEDSQSPIEILNFQSIEPSSQLTQTDFDDIFGGKRRKSYMTKKRRKHHRTLKRYKRMKIGVK